MLDLPVWYTKLDINLLIKSSPEQQFGGYFFIAHAHTHTHTHTHGTLYYINL